MQKEIETGTMAPHLHLECIQLTLGDYMNNTIQYIKSVGLFCKDIATFFVGTNDTIYDYLCGITLHYFALYLG